MVVYGVWGWSGCDTGDVLVEPLYESRQLADEAAIRMNAGYVAACQAAGTSLDEIPTDWPCEVREHHVSVAQ